MTFESYCLLQEMKSVQNSPNDIVLIDDFCGTVSRLASTIDSRNEKTLSKKLSDGLLDICLQELLDESCISEAGLCDGVDSYTITHHGYNYTKYLVSGIFAFFAKSIATPIIVSVLTTWITLKLFGQI